MRRYVHTLFRCQWLPRGLLEVFEFFERPKNLPLITPPWLGLRVLTPGSVEMATGLTLDYTVRALGVRTHWRSRIAEYDPPNGFRDVQVIGPYRLWDHQHRFRRESGGTVVEDFVVYELPLGPLGTLVHRALVRRRLAAVFDYRRERIAQLLDVGWSGTRREFPAGDDRR